MQSHTSCDPLKGPWQKKLDLRSRALSEDALQEWFCTSLLFRPFVAVESCAATIATCNNMKIRNGTLAFYHVRAKCIPKNKSYQWSYASVICMNNETRLELTIQPTSYATSASACSLFFIFFSSVIFSFFLSLPLSLSPCDDYYYYLFGITPVNTFYSLLVCCLSGAGEWFGVCATVAVFARLPERRAHSPRLNLLRISITRSSRRRAHKISQMWAQA